MKVIPTVGFTSTIDGTKYRAQEGVAIDMPEGADWVTAGLAVPAKEAKKESKPTTKSGKKGK